MAELREQSFCVVYSCFLALSYCLNQVVSFFPQQLVSERLVRGTEAGVPKVSIDGVVRWSVPFLTVERTAVQGWISSATDKGHEDCRSQREEKLTDLTDTEQGVE